MSGPVRVTGPLLDVLELLLHAWQGDEDLHGWAIMKAVKRSGPTVYGVLDRLEDADWVTAQWEVQHAESSRPRRRFYRLTPNGEVAARDLLATRRASSATTGRRRSDPGLAWLAWPVRPHLGGAR
jgi:DNA-binding PadR family transcriptional regulator